MTKLAQAEFHQVFAGMRREFGLIGPIVLDFKNNQVPLWHTTQLATNNGYWFLRAFNVVSCNDNNPRWS